MTQETYHKLPSVKIGDHEHLVRRIIKGGNKDMMPREFTENSAAKLRQLINDSFPDVDNTIYIRGLKLTPDLFTGVTTSDYKLCVMQQGAMTDIREMEQIGSSADKTMGDKDNFGMGSRTCSLPWTDVAYITRENGVSKMLVLGIRQNKVKVIVPVDDISVWVEANAKDRNYPKGDFTEVMLLGKNSDPAQNTVMKPWPPKEAGMKRSVPKNFWTASLHRRFCEMPHKIVFQKGKTEEGDTFASGRASATFGRNFITWHDAFMKANKITLPNKEWIYECPVAKEDNSIKLHYYFDPKKLDASGNEEPISTGSTASMSSVAFNGLIWKSNSGYKEYFDVQAGNNKTIVDQMTGIIGGNDHFRMFVELPTDAFEPGDDRTSLRTSDELEGVTYRDYITMLVSNMSDKYKAKIEEYATAKKGKNLDDRLKNRLDRLKNLAKLSTVQAGGVTKTNGANGTNKQTSNTGNNNGTKGKKKKPYTHNNVLTVSAKNNTMTSPEWELITYKEVTSAELDDFIARYLSPTKPGERPTLLINVQHVLIDKIIEELKCTDLVKVKIRPFVIEEIKLKLGTKCCLNKSLVDDNEYDYSHSDFKESVKDPALLASAIFYEEFLPDLRKTAKALNDMELAGTLATDSEELDPETVEKWKAIGDVEFPKKTGTDNK